LIQGYYVLFPYPIDPLIIRSFIPNVYPILLGSVLLMLYIVK